MMFTQDIKLIKKFYGLFTYCFENCFFFKVNKKSTIICLITVKKNYKSKKKHYIQITLFKFKEHHESI